MDREKLFLRFLHSRHPCAYMKRVNDDFPDGEMLAMYGSNRSERQSGNIQGLLIFSVRSDTQERRLLVDR